MAGVLCLWMGVMEVMRRSGLSDGLSRLLRPVLRRLYPEFARDREVMDTISANVSANLLGLGNAATPLGIQAARQMSRRTPGRASDALCMLVVCNTASIQLIPTTVASVRLAAGCAAPFDILPAVWLASVISVCAGIGAVKLFGRVWRVGMELFFTMLVPLIIAAVALYGMARRVDVYDALVQGAGEGWGCSCALCRPWWACSRRCICSAPPGRWSWRPGRWPRCSPPWASAGDRGTPAGAAGQRLGSPGGGGGAHRHLRPRLLIGRTAAVMLGSTETTFYTIAVYFGAAGIVKTRYAVPAALCADLAGFMAAAWAVRVIFY